MILRTILNERHHKSYSPVFDQIYIIIINTKGNDIKRERHT